MRIVTANPDAFEPALALLRSDEVVIIPTDTVYGLAADSGSQAGIEKLRALKGRDGTKPFQWLASGVEEVRGWVSDWNDRLDHLAGRYWPGPLTIVIQGIGWRVPNQPFVRELIGRLGRPLAASSANQSGEPPALSAGDAAGIFEGRIPLAIDGGTGNLGRASSVVRAEGEVLEILREEAVSGADLRRIWGQPEPGASS